MQKILCKRFYAKDLMQKAGSRVRDCREMEATKTDEFPSKNRGISVIFWNFYVWHFAGDCMKSG